LTDLGRDLTVPVIALGDWAKRNQGRIEAARAASNARQSAPRPESMNHSGASGVLRTGEMAKEGL